MLESILLIKADMFLGRGDPTLWEDLDWEFLTFRFSPIAERTEILMPVSDEESREEPGFGTISLRNSWSMVT